MNRIVFGTITVFTSVIVTLLILEVVLRVMDLGYGNLPIDSDPVLHHVHPTNYEYVARDPKGEYGGFKIYFDQYGLSANPNNIESANNSMEPEDVKYRVAFMGDSFTEAVHVPFEETFVGILEEVSKGNTVIRNYGVRSYSPILFLLQWREKVKEFNPTHVILQFYSNDIADDVKWSKTAVYSNSGELIAVVGEGGVYKKVLRNSYVARLIRTLQLKISWLIENWSAQKNVVGGVVEENPDLTEMSTEFVLKLAREVRGSGAEFAIMVVPSKYRLVNDIYDDTEPEFSHKWMKWAQDNSIDFIDMVEPFIEADKRGEELFWEIDIHYNTSGHEVTAEQIKQRYPEVFTN